MRRDGTRSGWLARVKTWTRSLRRGNRSGGNLASSPTSGSGDFGRSKRLGTLLYLYRGGHSDPLQFRDELHPDEFDSLADLTEEDVHLTNACLEVERDLLNQEWRSVSMLLARDMFGEEEAEAKLDEAMERDELGHIAGEVIALMNLGLLD